MRGAGESKRLGGAASTAVALVLLLAGAVLLFAPLVQNAVSQAAMNGQIDEVRRVLAAGSAGEGGGGAGAGAGDAADSGANAAAASGDTDGSPVTAADLSLIKQWLEQYNQKVSAGEISISSDPFSFDGTTNLFASQGLEDGLIGYIEIPKMNCSLPLYLGSSEAHMAKGATVVSGSSAPLGGESSNCVIAAHRGYANAAMFRDIEDLSPGDKVYVYSLWEKLTYTVVNTKVISPSDTAAVGVQKGRDMVSLSTCHPYGYNSSRYIVECERGEGVSAQEAVSSGQMDDQQAPGCDQDQSKAQTEAAQSVSWLSLTKLEDYLRAIGGAILLLCAAILLVRFAKERRKRKGNQD